MYLSMLSAQQVAIVHSVESSRLIAHRLASMGISPGCEIKMLRNTRKGSLVIELRGTYLAISREIAQQITLAQHEESRP